MVDRRLFGILSTSVPTPPGGLDTAEEKDLLTQLHLTTLLLQMDLEAVERLQSAAGTTWGLSSDFFLRVSQGLVPLKKKGTVILCLGISERHCVPFFWTGNFQV